MVGGFKVFLNQTEPRITANQHVSAMSIEVERNQGK